MNEKNNPVTVAEENKRLEENPIAPVNPPVTTATEVPTAPTVSVEANKEVANVGGTAPVVSTPPTPTPAPTDYKWDATTNSYKEIPKTETPTPAPTTAATPTPKAATAVATPEVKAGVETKPQEYYDQFKGRENEVLTNLNSAYSSGIKDAEGIKKFASYDTATPEKKAAIDAFIANKQKEELSAKEGSQFGSEEGIFGALNNNVMVPDSVKSTPAYKAAFDRYRKLKFLSGYSANDIAAILKNGKLVPGSRTYQDLYNTAIGKANIEKANKILNISGNAVDVTQAGKNLTQETLKDNPTIAKALEDGEISIEEFKALTSSPELEAEAKVLAEKQLEIKKLQSARNKIRDDVDKEYGGGLTSSEKAALVANRTRDINRLLEPLVLEYESAFGTYSEKKKEALSLFSTNYELYKERKAEEAKKSAIEEQRDYETKKEARKNIYDSVSSQIKFALENGVDLKRTDANVVIADAQAYATANGVSLEEGIKKTFTEPLTSKPSYRAALQAIYDKNSGALTPYQKAQLAQGSREFAQTMRYNYDRLALEEKKFAFDANKPDWEQDKETGEWVNKNSLYSPGKTVDDKGEEFSVDNYSTTRNGSTSVTCGQLTNDYISDVTGGTFKKTMGDSYESKEAVIDALGRSDVPVVGGVFVFPTNNPYGHTGIVSAIHPDGSITVREANRANTPNGKSPAETHKYSANKVAEMSFSVAPNRPAYYTDEYVSSIIAQMGGVSRVDKEEGKRIERQAKGYMKEGLSPTQAALRVAEFKIKDAENEDVALDLFNKSRNFKNKDVRDNFGRIVSTHINDGNFKAAFDYFEKEVDNDVKATYGADTILSGDRRNTAKYNNELVSLIKANKGELGKVSGTINELVRKFESSPKLQKIATILQKIQADERKYFAGSAVTETEMDALKDFIGGKTTMQPDNLVVMLETIEEMNNNKFKEQRRAFGY